MSLPAPEPIEDWGDEDWDWPELPKNEDSYYADDNGADLASEGMGYDG